MVCAYRARASRGDGSVADDPWASALAGDEGFALAQAYDRAFPHMELWIGLRTRFIDDAVRLVLDRGTRQVVVLGAGMDTRSARLARGAVRYFEVDQPASQAEKRAAIEGLAGYPGEAATLVSCDFEHNDFLDRLASGGFDPDEPALFLWEGVSYYLSEAAVRATAARIAQGAHPGSALLFDYVMRNMGAGTGLRPEDTRLRDFVADLGEPIRFGMDDAFPLLYECGLPHVRSVSFERICATYTGTWEPKRAFRYQHIALASRDALESPWG